ncbi:MAG: Uma2 family endonuclease [Hyphomicrobiales bacterium]|nr:Uma2 family endonuclease [Hyphomicrobiales bacterium]
MQYSHAMKPARKHETFTIDAFLAWAEKQDEGRYELVEGVIRAMAPGRAPHADVKRRIANAFEAAIKRAGAPCLAFVDGLGVKTTETTVRIPDALVNCGGRITRDTMIAPSPVIVVEVISPTSENRDLNRKYFEYFQHSAVHHYLIVDTGDRSVLHHYRAADGSVRSGGTQHGEALRFDPPGIEVVTGAFFEGLDAIPEDDGDI